jgi:hypothetical protein
MFMNEIFKEQLIKKVTTKSDVFYRTGFILLFILISFALLFLFSFAPIIIMILGLALYYALTRLNKEYEYTFASGELDIDVIINRSKRKKKLSVTLNNVEFMAHINDKNHSFDSKNIEQTIDCSSGIITDNTYAFLINYNGKKTKIIIEPNDNMLNSFKTVLNSRKLFLK